MAGEQIRAKRALAKIPGHVLCSRAGLSRTRLSGIEAGYVAATPEELARIERALNGLIEARRKVARYASECGWPMAAT